MSWFHAGPTVEHVDTILNPDHVTDVQRKTDDDGQIYVHVWMSAGGTGVRRNIFGGDQAEAVWQWARQQAGSRAASGMPVQPVTDAPGAQGTVDPETL
jgi:hypothetical protein